MARRPKTLTRQQLESRKHKAVRFTRDVAGDPDRAVEIEGESLDDYAERRRIQLVNQGRGSRMAKQSIEDYRAQVADLKQQIRELEDENETLNDKLDNIADVLEPELEAEDEGGDEDDDTELD
jgi:predicted RNase H-like nuclease (RuvC/YqgF family)